MSLAREQPQEQEFDYTSLTDTQINIMVFLAENCLERKRHTTTRFRHSELANAIGCTVRTIVVLTKELAELGLFRKEVTIKGRTGYTVYRLSRKMRAKFLDITSTPFYFSRLSRTENRTLGRSAKIILNHIYQGLDKSPSKTYAVSIKKLSELLGKSRNSPNHAMAVLKSKGLIDVAPKDRHARCEYIFGENASRSQIPQSPRRVVVDTSTTILVSLKPKKPLPNKRLPKADPEILLLDIKRVFTKYKVPRAGTKYIEMAYGIIDSFDNGKNLTTRQKYAIQTFHKNNLSDIESAYQVFEENAVKPEIKAPSRMSLKNESIPKISTADLPEVMISTKPTPEWMEEVNKVRELHKKPKKSFFKSLFSFFTAS